MERIGRKPPETMIERHIAGLLHAAEDAARLNDFIDAMAGEPFGRTICGTVGVAGCAAEAFMHSPAARS
jgi:hypothetical protein